MPHQLNKSTTTQVGGPDGGFGVKLIRTTGGGILRVGLPDQFGQLSRFCGLCIQRHRKSVVASRTIGEVLRLDVQLLHQGIASSAHVDRIGFEWRRASIRRACDPFRWGNSTSVRAARWQKNFISGSQFRRGIAVAIKAPTHAEWFAFRHQRHIPDISMASRAAHAFRNMNAMVEENVIGEGIDPIPMQGLLPLCAEHDRAQHRGVGENLRMAGHARLRRRHAGKSGGFDGDVAIATIDAQLTGVMAVAEKHGLIAGQANTIPVRRAVVFKGRIRDCHDTQRRAQQSHAEQRRGARAKKRHGLSVGRRRTGLEIFHGCGDPRSWRGGAASTIYSFSRTPIGDQTEVGVVQRPRGGETYT